MNKILVRAGISPLETFSPGKMIVRNSIGSNVGNLIYQFGVFRVLTTKETTLIPDYYGVDRGRITSANHKEINKKYTAYICPLADAFRDNFVHVLNSYTELIKKLKIPFVVAGVGLKTTFRDTGKRNFPFDDAVIDFVEAVNATGTIVGIRGQITGNYLSHLGFREKKDFMVIGCPSMFSFGANMKIRDTNITESSKISINSSLKSPMSTLDFISNTCKKFPNHYFIPQWLSEFKLTYLGQPNLKNKHKSDIYPTKIESNEYKNNLVRYPLNARGWIELLKTVDLSFGPRLHGNIAAAIAGTPNIVVIKDGRMRELAAYHNLTRVTPGKLKSYESLSELIEKIDFHAPEKGHEKRFKNYLTFWAKNNIPTIYDSNFNEQKAELDDKMQSIPIIKPIETIYGLKKNDLNKRFEDYESERKKWSKEKKYNLFKEKIFTKLRYFQQ